VTADAEFLGGSARAVIYCVAEKEADGAPVMEAFEEKMRRGGEAAVAEACRFFMRDDPVHLALQRIARRLEEHGIPYAIAGGMALVKHGYDRTTVDVDVLVTPEGLAAVHRHLEGLGYVPPFANSKHLRDTETGVRIEFLVSGGFPGDGKPKPVAFPDPAACSVEMDGVRYIGLTTLLEMKISSGMTNPGRLKDLADVLELIRVRALGSDFAAQLHPYVRDKYLELWRAVQQDTSGQE